MKEDSSLKYNRLGREMGTTFVENRNTIVT